jgi:hypothetical protein
MRRLFSLLGVFALIFAFAGSAFSQESPTGSLVGTVTDPQGAVVLGAKITVSDIAGGEKATAESGDGGHFTVANLSPGNYQVSIEKSGFKTASIINITIIVGKTYELPVKLEIGEASVTLEINGGGEQLIETQSASVSSTISGKPITQLPLNSRSAILLGVLDPTAQTSGGSRNTTFEGLPSGAINITFDGINVQDNLLKSADGFFAIQDPRIDDVQEFGITTAANSPDKSGEGAVQLNYVSNKGGNAFHGGVWEYNRNTAFDANTSFNNLTGQPRQTLQLNDYGFKVGGPILKNKLFFFMDLDTIHLPLSIPRQRNILTTGANGAANGVFSYIPVGPDGQTPTLPAFGTTNPQQPWVTCNGNTASPLCTVNLFSLAAAGGFPNSVNPAIAPVLNAVESSATAPGVTLSPTQPSLFQEQINFNSKGASTSYLPDIRLDYTASKRHSFEFDYHYSHVFSNPDVLNGGDATFPVPQFIAEAGSQGSNRNLFVGAWRWTINSNMSNELRAGINSAPVNFGLGINANTFPSIGTNLGPEAFTFGITGVSTIFHGLGGVQGRNSAFGQLADNFAWTKGSHNISIGVNTTLLYYNDFVGTNATVGFGIDNINDPIANTGNAGTNGAAVFSGGPGSCVTLASCAAGGTLPNIDTNQFANAEGIYASLTGRINSFNSSVFFSPKTGNFLSGAPLTDRWRQNEFGIYAADSWRVRPNLTFNYGLRWEYSGAPYDTENEYFQVQGALTGGADGVFGISGFGNLFKPGIENGVANQTLVSDVGKSWYNAYYGAFAPTVGLAWQPHTELWGLKHLIGGAGKTVLRAGYNIAYSREGLATFSSIAGGNPGYFGSQFSNSGPANDPVNGRFVAGSVILGNNTSLADVGQSPNSFVNQFPFQPNVGLNLNAYDPNLKPPLVQSWSAGIQRELSANNVVEVRYQANHSSGLWDQYNINEVNIFENGFLTEFGHAASNLNICNNNPAACLAAEQMAGLLPATATASVPDFANLGLAGQVNLPILTGAFTASKTGAQGNPLFANTFFTNSLVQGQPGNIAAAIQGDSGLFPNLVAAGFPQNFFVANPNASQLNSGAFYLTNAAQSTYNALVVDFRRRPSHGLQFDASYTFAKALTNYQAGTSGNATVQFNQFTTLRNLGYDKGPAPFDIRNNLKGQLLYDLPFGAGRKWLNSGAGLNRLVGGWQISTVTRLQSGTPILITGGIGGTFNQNESGVTLTGITPDQIQSQLKVSTTELPGAVLYFPAKLLDPTLSVPNAAFFAPCTTPGQLCSKLYVYGPHFFKSDVSLTKITKITERVNFEMRLDALNVFNNPNFYYACGVSTSPCSISLQTPQFGNIVGDYSDFNSTQDPGGRVLQLIGRINF